METVKMSSDRVQLAIDAIGGKAALSVRIDRHVRQIENYLRGFPAPRYVEEKIEEVIREHERKNQKAM